MVRDERPEWGLTEIADEAGLNKTTAYRLLTALEAEGMVARASHGDAWRLGTETIALGALAVRSNDVVGASRPELAALVGDAPVLTDDYAPTDQLLTVRRG